MFLVVLWPKLFFGNPQMASGVEWKRGVRLPATSLFLVVPAVTFKKLKFLMLLAPPAFGGSSGDFTSDAISPVPALPVLRAGALRIGSRDFVFLTRERRGVSQPAERDRSSVAVGPSRPLCHLLPWILACGQLDG